MDQQVDSVLHGVANYTLYKDVLEEQGSKDSLSRDQEFVVRDLIFEVYSNHEDVMKMLEDKVGNKQEIFR